MNKYIKANQKNWDERTPVHISSKRYGVASFKKGRITLKQLELEELGSVKGKSLLHLQCHFGLDSMSFARLGAKVTAVDFSGDAINYAKELNKELNLNVKFIQSDIFELSKKLHSKFDVVFASYGIFCWIPDVNKWLEIASSFLKKGGILYVVDDHPFHVIFDDKKLCYSSFSSYFSDKPVRIESEGTYVDRKAKIKTHTYQWTHKLSDFINGALRVGLKLEFIHEFPFTVWERFPGLMKTKGRYYVMKDNKIKIPLLFSLKASK